MERKTHNALLSVYHKDGIAAFAKTLIDHGYKIYASGGTCTHLVNNGVEAIDVATLVGGGAILGHRVVTLSREVHAGLMSRNIPEDNAELAKRGIPRFDLVCVDLYPLEAEVAREGSTLESVIEKTDIGGPTLIRSAVKGGRIVICDPADRAEFVDWLEAGEPDDGFVEELAAKAEFVIARYCALSASYRSSGEYLGIFGTRIETCKYGENAHQAPAYLYERKYECKDEDPLGVTRFMLCGGAGLGYNGYTDLDRAIQTITHIAAVRKFNGLQVGKIAVAVKHGNACGAAVSMHPSASLELAYLGDATSVYGGMIIANFPITEHIAEWVGGKFLSCIVAPSFDPGTIEKMRNVGNFLDNPALGTEDVCLLDQQFRFRYVRGGFLTQPNYLFMPLLFGGIDTSPIARYEIAGSAQEADMLLAWAVGSTSNSNTITLVKDGQLIGNGVGQQDRVGAAGLAVVRANNAGHKIVGAVAYSDSFFPFPDGPKLLIDSGVTAIFASSGSKRDNETIKLCQERGISLYMIPDALGRGFCAH